MKSIFLNYSCVFMGLISVKSSHGQNTSISIDDSIKTTYLYYDFFDDKGKQLDNANPKTRKQLTTITLMGNQIQKIEFVINDKTKTLQLTDTLPKIGYKVFTSSSIHRGIEYKSIIFMSLKNIFSFSYSKEIPNKAFVNAIFNKGITYNRASGYIHNLDIQNIIYHLEKGKIDKDNCQYCKGLIHFDYFDKSGLEQPKKIKKFFSLWYNLAI